VQFITDSKILQATDRDTVRCYYTLRRWLDFALNWNNMIYSTISVSLNHL